MRRVYSRFPGITVAPLHFAPENLNAYGLLAMMKIDQDQRMFHVSPSRRSFYQGLNNEFRYAPLYGMRHGNRA